MRVCFSLAVLGSIAAASREFGLDLADELRRYGPVADVEYYIVERAFPVHAAEDLRLKIWVGWNINKDNPDQVLVTLVRTDNVLERPDIPLPKRYVRDRLWEGYRGWPVSFKLVVTNLRQYVTIPRLPDSEVFQFHCTLPGVSPATTRMRDIPRNYIAVTHDERDKPWAITQRISALNIMRNPGYNAHVFSADSMGEYIEAHEGAEARSLFEQLQPMAYRVDLFRLIALYHLGGVYMDSKVFSLKPLESILPAAGGMFPYDIGRLGIWNALLAMPQKDVFMRRGIDMIYENIRNRAYTNDSLGITGPGLVLKAYSSLTGEQQARYTSNISFDNTADFVHTDKGQRLFAAHNCEYRRQMKYRSKCYYSDIWIAGGVYHERTCHPESGIFGGIIVSFVIMRIWFAIKWVFRLT